MEEQDETEELDENAKIVWLFILLFSANFNKFSLSDYWIFAILSWLLRAIWVTRSYCSLTLITTRHFHGPRYFLFYLYFLFFLLDIIISEPYYQEFIFCDFGLTGYFFWLCVQSNPAGIGGFDSYDLLHEAIPNRRQNHDEYESFIFYFFLFGLFGVFFSTFFAHFSEDSSAIYTVDNVFILYSYFIHPDGYGTYFRNSILASSNLANLSQENKAMLEAKVCPVKTNRY
jgi:hypothetical protein